MMNGGQTCISIERVYVEEPVYDEFVAKVTEKATRPAPGRAGRARLGRRRRRSPSPSRWTSSRSHVNDAVAKGARVLVGGHRKDGPGDFFEPTVLVDVDHTMK